MNARSPYRTHRCATKIINTPEAPVPTNLVLFSSLYVKYGTKKINGSTDGTNDKNTLYHC
jgi:hypothetical protein